MVTQGILMQFIIDKDIYFRPADGAIWRIDTENEKKHLTLTNSRLLTYLIEHRGEVITRDAVFQSVWEAYGLHSSNNTLNQYISLLRRIFTDLGAGPQLIKTIPKTGFMFNAEVHIVREAEENKTSKPDKGDETPPRYKQIARVSLPALLLISLLISLWLWQRQEESERFTAVCWQMKDRKQCEIFSLEGNNTLRALSSAEKMKYMKLIEDRVVECQPPPLAVAQKTDALTASP